MSVRKHISQPWFDYIKSGKKIYEGRLRDGFWAKAQKGTFFIAHDGSGNELVLQVLDVYYFDGPVEAWKNLESNLIPIPGMTVEKIEELYYKFNSKEEIAEKGFVVLHVKVV